MHVVIVLLRRVRRCFFLILFCSCSPCFPCLVLSWFNFVCSPCRARTRGGNAGDIHSGYDPIVDKEMHGLLVDVQGHSEISALDAMLGNMLVLETSSGHMSVCCIPEFMEQFEWRRPLVQSDVRRCVVRISCLRRPVVERGGVL